RKRHPTEPFIVMLKLARSGSILGHYFDPLNVVRATIGSTTPTVRIGSAHGKEPGRTFSVQITGMAKVGIPNGTYPALATNDPNEFTLTLTSPTAASGVGITAVVTGTTTPTITLA